MPLIVIVGDVRTGKTSLMSALAMDMIEDMGDQVQVYHNYNFQHPNAIKVQPEDLYKITRDGKEHLVLLDEAYAWLEARCSGTNEVNEYLSYILFQSGKDETTFVLTVQLFSTIDRRFRKMANILIEAERDPSGFIYTFMKPDLSDWSMYYIEESDMEPYFEAFKTFEKVQPIDENMLIRVITDKTKLGPEVSKIIDKLHEINKGTWTRGAIDAWLRNNRYAEAYGKYVYEELKLRETIRKGQTVTQEC